MTGFHAIPTNIITGFLGVGKTTAIQWLLKTKPVNETWAVLVNEFGEIGIDGNLLNAGNTGDEGVYIRELPGGCMCCTAGVPFQVALNQLIKQSRPQRLLIEPTGLGHPHEVIAMLSSSHYADIIDLQATLTLIDARKISQPRYREHETFRQQLQVADRIIANKRDLYQDSDAEQLHDFLKLLQLHDLPVDLVEQGRLDWRWLEATHRKKCDSFDFQENNVSVFDFSISLPKSGYKRINKRQSEFFSSGWVFAASFRFDFERIFDLMNIVEADRLKAIVHTERGWAVFNKADGVVSHTWIDDGDDSRIEVIGQQSEYWENLESELLNAVLD